MNKVRSARGAIVNFDLLKIKQQIATAPKPIVVQARESFVDQRNKRRARRATPLPEATLAQDENIVEENSTIGEDTNGNTQTTQE